MICHRWPALMGLSLPGNLSVYLFVDMLLFCYDTRCYINVRSKADMSRLNLQHGDDN